MAIVDRVLQQGSGQLVKLTPHDEHLKTLRDALKMEKPWPTQPPPGTTTGRA